MSHQALSPAVNHLLQQISQGAFVLPSMPDIAARVRQLKREHLDDEKLQCQMLANIISSDPVMSARILALSNSQLDRQLTMNLDVDEAVHSLGFHLCSNAAIGLALKKAYVAEHTAIAAEMAAHWRYTSAVAVTAVAIARHVGTVRPEQAMLAALLHRIGALALLKHADKSNVLAHSKQERLHLIDQTASMIGDYAIALWDLPERYSALAKDVADFECQRPVSELVHVVRVAICVVSTLMSAPLLIPEWDKIQSFDILGFNPNMDDDKQLSQFAVALQSAFLASAA
jgi:HD-like signal output (HDOD) protein